MTRCGAGEGSEREVRLLFFLAFFRPRCWVVASVNRSVSLIHTTHDMDMDMDSAACTT
jgi:hypothetical protein